MLNHLMASDNRSHPFLSPSAISTSGVLHIAILAGAIYLSVNAPEVVRKDPDLVTFFDLPKPAAPPAVVEPPRPPPVTVSEVKTPPPPKGFQELVPPKDPPAAIPEVDVSAPAVSVEDFSGIGQAGGTSRGVEGGTPQDVTRAPEPAPEAAPGFAYEVAVLDSPPHLRNPEQIVSALARLYPPMLLKAGISGIVTIRFVVQPDGTVDASTIRVADSSHELFDEPSMEIAQRFRFRPGRYRGKPVRVLIQMPIQWEPARR